MEMERTIVFTSIFHFYDDFSKPNLRLIKFDRRRAVGVSHREISELKKAWMTWAPSHLEMASLMQLLCYANIINGLKPNKKRELWYELEGKKEFNKSVFSTDELARMVVPDEIKKNTGLNKKVMMYSDLEKGEILYTCTELCPEYIDYLKKVIKPYIH